MNDFIYFDKKKKNFNKKKINKTHLYKNVAHHLSPRSHLYYHNIYLVEHISHLCTSTPIWSMVAAALTATIVVGLIVIAVVEVGFLLSNHRYYFYFYQFCQLYYYLQLLWQQLLLLMLNFDLVQYLLELTPLLLLKQMQNQFESGAIEKISVVLKLMKNFSISSCCSKESFWSDSYKKSNN